MKRKLLLVFFAFCLSFITMVGLSLFSIGRFTTFTDYSEEVLHTNQVIRNLYKTEVFLKDLDRWERGYMLTRDTVYLRVMNNMIDSLYPSLYVLERLLSDNPEQRKNVLFLKSNVVLRMNFSRSNIDYIDSTHSKEASPYYFEGRKYMIASNRTIRAMHKLENHLLTVRFKKQQVYQQLTTSTLKFLLVVFCIVTLFLFMLLLKVMRSGMLYQKELYGRVIDLKRSHLELQDIAYAISHDLQEPLRKIQVFSNMLIFRKSDHKEEETKATLLRINNSANRMQSLIADLMSLTDLTKTGDSKSPADLNKLIQIVLADLQDKIIEKDAVIEIHPLPVIHGYEAQLKILFKALLDNALKFTKDGLNADISITYKNLNGNDLQEIKPSLRKQEFHCISITDNGIGFDNKYITNIFRIFRRLHAEQSQYEGKGLGLAICQRIMANHEGYIRGEGAPQKGATFMLIFPA